MKSFTFDIIANLVLQLNMDKEDIAKYSHLFKVTAYGWATAGSLWIPQHIEGLLWTLGCRSSTPANWCVSAFWLGKRDMNAAGCFSKEPSLPLV